MIKMIPSFLQPLMCFWLCQLLLLKKLLKSELFLYPSLKQINIFANQIITFDPLLFFFFLQMNDDPGKRRPKHDPRSTEKDNFYSSLFLFLIFGVQSNMIMPRGLWKSCYYISKKVSDIAKHADIHKAAIRGETAGGLQHLVLKERLCPQGWTEACLHVNVKCVCVCVCGFI